VLVVGGAGGSVVRQAPSPDSKDEATLAHAVRRAQRKPRSKLEAFGAKVDRAEDRAEEQTTKAERADDLFKTLVGGELDPGAIAGDIDALLGWIAQLDREGRFESVVSAGRRVSRLLALAQRWLDLLRSLQTVKDAAERAHDLHGVAWASHELGTLHLCADDSDRASRLLEEARRIRSELGDRVGLAATEHNLQMLCGRVQQLMRERRLRRPAQYLRSPLILGLAAALLGGGVAAGAVVSSTGSTRSTGPAAPKATHAPPLRFTLRAPPSGTVGRPYEFNYSVSRADPVYAITAGVGPPGLSLSQAGVLSGTPTTQGTFTFTVTATGRDGASASRQDSVSIAPRQAPSINFTPASPGPATVGQPYTFRYLTSGDSPAALLVTAGGTPPRLTLAPNGVLSGDPTTAGSFTFTVTAIGTAGGRVSRQDTIRVAQRPAATITFGSAQPPPGTVDQSYSFAFTATGDSGIVYAYEGSLPPGLALADTGQLSGTPTAAGTYSFSVSATGASGAAAQEQIVISIAGPPPPPPPVTASTSTSTATTTTPPNYGAK
jgi:hypothetical protein